MNAPTTRPAVLVIGAGGALGALVVDAFRRRGWTVHDAGRRPTSSPTFRHVDLADATTLPAAVEGIDLVVSTVPDPGLAAERHVLDHGGVMLNLSAEPATALEELRGRDARRGSVMMNAGVAPGVTNLVAAALLEDHPDADELELVFTMTTRGSGGRAAAAFAHRGLTGVARHRTSTVPLGSPFGTRRVLGFAEADGGWLGPVADSVSVSTYVSITERPVQHAMLLLNRARLLPLLPRAAVRPTRPPTVVGASTEPVAHHVTALSAGRRLATASVRGHGDFRMAADSSAVFGGALIAHGDGRPVAPGAWYPEEVLTLGELVTPLAEAGITVDGLEDRRTKGGLGVRPDIGRARSGPSVPRA